MTAWVRWGLLAAGLAAALAIVLWVQGDGISDEAQALIDRGDAAIAEAETARQGAEEITAALAALPEPGVDATGRSLAAADGDAAAAERARLESELARLTAEIERLEAAATEAWTRAAAIDAEAQDAILQRLRGVRPRS